MFLLSVIGQSDKARPGSGFGVKFKTEDVNFSHLSELLNVVVARFITKTLLFNNDEEIRLGQGQTRIHIRVKKFQLLSEHEVVLNVWVLEIPCQHSEPSQNCQFVTVAALITKTLDKNGQ